MKIKPRREGARIYDGWWMLAALCLRIKVAVLIRDLEPDKGFPSRVSRLCAECFGKFELLQVKHS